MNAARQEKKIDAIPPMSTIKDEDFEGSVCFPLHFNGDWENSTTVCTEGANRFDDVLSKMCAALGLEDALCAPSSGARLYDRFGRRLMQLSHFVPKAATYLVPQGLHFSWPSVKVGHRFNLADNEGEPIRNSANEIIELTTLSLQPKVFRISHFVTKEELAEILEVNRDKVAPSQTGFTGKEGDRTRTSKTAWDQTSAVSKVLLKRAFELVRMDHDNLLGDSVQVLNYQPTQYYKPHTDWFAPNSYKRSVPKINNGTNRYLTVFVYLNDVPAGGHTVFPHSTSHAGYGGEYLTHEGTVNTPSYIADKDAAWVCNESSTALRAKPVAGSAVLFYSQLADGTLDPYSLHGGCPVVEGEKWSANIWIWNRPRPGNDEATDVDRKKNDNGQLTLNFKSEVDEAVKMYWESPSGPKEYKELVSGETFTVNTYAGHTWLAKYLDGREVFRYTVDAEDPEDIFITEHGPQFQDGDAEYYEDEE